MQYIIRSYPPQGILMPTAIRAMHTATIIPTRQNKTMNINELTLFIFGFIPKYPDIRMYELTHTRASDSTIYLIADDTGCPAISASEGAPREKKSTCTTNTSSIATIRSNSKLDWRGDLLTPPY